MTTKVRPYQLKTLKTGCEVFGIDLRNVVQDHVVDLIKEDVKNHRLLVFRDQGILSSERHLEISRWFGVVETTYVSKIRIYADKGILGFLSDITRYHICIFNVLQVLQSSKISS